MRGRKPKPVEVVTLDSPRIPKASESPSYLRVAEKRLWRENQPLVPNFGPEHRHLMAQWCITLWRVIRLERKLYSIDKLTCEGHRKSEVKNPIYSALLAARADWAKINSQLGLTPRKAARRGKKPPSDQTNDDVLDGNF